MSISNRNHLRNLLEVVQLCNKLQNDTREAYFKVQPPLAPAYYIQKINENQREYWFFLTPLYLSTYKALIGVIEISDLVGIKQLELIKPQLHKIIHELQTAQVVSNYNKLVYRLNIIRNWFSSVQSELAERVSRLDNEEKYRLDDAIHCFFEDCNLSSAIMAISAVENRLLRLLIKGNPAEQDTLESLTLGQLISQYLKNKQRYAGTVPERHHELLNLCNKYRIYAVHPKGQEISRNIAGAILRLTFEFLMDEKTS
jgi:hypothetical protein